MTVSFRWLPEPPILIEWVDDTPIAAEWKLTPPIVVAWPERMDQTSYLPTDDDVPYPAPPGFHWEFVFSMGRPVFVDSEPVVHLVENL